MTSTAGAGDSSWSGRTRTPHSSGKDIRTVAQLVAPASISQACDSVGAGFRRKSSMVSDRLVPTRVLGEVECCCIKVYKILPSRNIPA